MRMAVAVVCDVSRAIRVENEQPVASVLSKSNIAILPASAPALVTVHVVGPAVNVALTMSPVTSNVCGPDIEMPRPYLLATATGARSSRLFASAGNVYIRIRG